MNDKLNLYTMNQIFNKGLTTFKKRHWKHGNMSCLIKSGQDRNQGGEEPPWKIFRTPLEKYVGHILKVMDIV